MTEKLQSEPNMMKELSLNLPLNQSIIQAGKYIVFLFSWDVQLLLPCIW